MPSRTTYITYQFTCCKSTDINQVWHPGDAVELHWVVEPSTATVDRTAHSVVLTAVLSGPYADVPALKKGASSSHAIQGSVIRTNNLTSTLPVTIFILPSDLPPGYYELRTKVDLGSGNSTSGDSIVRVGAQ